MASSLSNLVNNLSEGIHKLNVNTDTMMKKCETCKLNINIATKYELREYKCLCCDKNYQQKFDENLKLNNFLIHTNFLTMITISLCYCCKKVFILKNIWIINKNSMKHHFLKKKIFTST